MQVINNVKRVNPFANMNNIEIISNMENNIDETITLSEHDKNKMLAECKCQYDVMQSEIKDITDVEKLKDYLENNFKNCQYQNDTQYILSADNEIYAFSFIIDNMLFDGYITPYGTILSKNIIYNTFDENDMILYNINIKSNELSLLY